MKYRGYTGSVEYDAEDRLFHGRVDGITDIVSFQGDTVEALEADFRAGVDDYLEFCKERGVEPQRPCSGRFVLRVSPELHREAAIAARSQRESLNTWIAGAIEARLAAKERPAARARPNAKRAA
jgi:predicted HicB family RNase H-like nuclease